MLKTFTCRTLSDTVRLAEKLASMIRPPCVVALTGDLGAGKTEFVRAVLGSFGFSSVKSPTFTIVREYEGEGRFYHIDAYRLNSSEELFDVGFEDFLSEDAVIFIEWADLVEDALPSERLNVMIEGCGKEPRRIVIESTTERLDAVIAEL